MESDKKIKSVDLFAFLLLKHPDKVIREGKSLKLKDNHSISLKAGWKNYNNFKAGKGGNGLKLLVDYLGYIKESAIEEMSKFEVPEGFYDSIGISPNEKGAFVEPTHSINNDRCYDYLCGKRGIHPDIVRMLIDKGLLYQTEKGFCTNIVFLNQEKDYAEIHGTMNKHYTPKAEGSKEGGFWWFSPVENTLLKTVKRAYVCEASIDCISLYQLIMDRAIYISVGGARCQIAIDRVKDFCRGIGAEVIIATDNDTEGQGCRDRNKDVGYKIPDNYKDWNEELLNSPKRYIVK